jgi:hypothetical protein
VERSDSFLFDQTNIGYGGAFYNFTPNLGMNKVQENIGKKHVKSATLSPGQAVHGFLYVPVPPKGPRQKVHLQVPITKAGTSETFVLNLFFEEITTSTHLFESQFCDAGGRRSGSATTTPAGDSAAGNVCRAPANILTAPGATVGTVNRKLPPFCMTSGASRCESVKTT